MIRSVTVDDFPSAATPIEAPSWSTSMAHRKQTVCHYKGRYFRTTGKVLHNGKVIPKKVLLGTDRAVSGRSKPATSGCFQNRPLTKGFVRVGLPVSSLETCDGESIASGPDSFHFDVV